MKDNFSYPFYTMIRPISVFEHIKWDRKGSYIASIIIILAFFLNNVLDRQMTGFIYNSNNVDETNVPVIFFVTTGMFVLWFISNLAICSFMDGEGKSREIWIASAYSLTPYIILSLLATLLTNFLSVEASPFLAMLRLAAVGWSVLLMAIGMSIIHQYSLKQTVVNLMMTLAGIGVILFLLMLVFSLFQQVLIFFLTIYNELMFRL